MYILSDLIQETIIGRKTHNFFNYIISFFVFQKYIEPYFFGRKKKPIEESLEDINRKVDTRIDEVNHELTQIKDTLTQTTRDQTQQMNREFNNFRSDLEAIKGLLLNR